MNEKSGDSKEYFGIYLKQKASVLKEELALVSAAVGKTTSFKGTLYEAVLREALRDLLPNRVKVGTGFIVDVDTGQRSAQCDIIVYTDLYIAPVYRYGDFVVVSHKTAHAVIEVKSRLCIDVIKDAGCNLKNLLGCLPCGRPWLLVAAGTTIKQKTVKRHYDEHLAGCSGVLVLEGWKKEKKEENPYYLQKTECNETSPFQAFLKSILDATKLATQRS